MYLTKLDVKYKSDLFRCKQPSFGSGRKTNPFVTLGELDVEIGDEGLHVVVALYLQVEGGGEGDVLLSARLDVDLLDQARVRHNLEIEFTDFGKHPF